MPCATHPEVVTGLDTCSRCGKEFCQDCIIPLRGQPVCGACKREMVADIRSNVTEELDLAGAGARLGGNLIDSLVMGFGAGLLVAVILPLVLAGMGTAPRGHGHGGPSIALLLLVELGVILLVACYEPLMLAARGQTLGKMAVGIKVVRPDLRPISRGQAWGRGLGRLLLGFIPFVGLIDVLMVFSARRQTLHDRMAGTIVVKVSR